MAKGQAKDLFTASEVARFCQVDLKTIHNWAERGEIRHFRTPGRHLRFRRADVLDFLRKYGYPIPDHLLQGKPRVVLWVSDTEPLKRALKARFEISTYSDILEAMLAIGADPPDAIVLEQNGGTVEGTAIAFRLKGSDATRHVRVVLLSDNEAVKARAHEVGASAVVSPREPDKLRECLESLLGLDR